MAAAPLEDFVNYDFDWAGLLKIRRFGHRCFQRLELVMYFLSIVNNRVCGELQRFRGNTEEAAEAARSHLSYMFQKIVELCISKGSGDD